MWLEKLNEMGLEVPQASAPVANYLPAKVIGKQVWVSGQLPFDKGQLLWCGKVDKENLPQAVQSAKQCFLNALSAALTAVEASDLRGVDKIAGFVCSDSTFTDQAKVINGASDLAVALFGEQGKHVRAAVGVSSLPLGAAVEVEVIFSLEDE